MTASVEVAKADWHHDAMNIKPWWVIDSAWQGHVPFAAWLIAVARPRQFVELGSFKGMSYAAFCQAVQEQQLATRCFAVDTWQGDPHAGVYPEKFFQRLKRFNQRRFGGFSTLLRMTFDEAKAQFADGSVDLLHVDGFHTYEAVKHDFETWRPKLSPNAVVLFHDTQERSEGFGVWKFWAEVRRNRPSLEFTHSHGLGVLFLGEVPLKAAALITAMAQGSPSRPQAEFQALGDVVEALWTKEKSTRDPVSKLIRSIRRRL
jgi:hypothetical protein